MPHVLTFTSPVGPGWDHQAEAAGQDSGQTGDVVHAEPGGDDGQAHTGEANLLLW